MIVTLKDYINHYGNLSKDNHPKLSIFLGRIFNTKYVVLFIGYGLEDVVEAAARVVITAIIQPGGSLRDEDSIRAANEHYIAMVFTGMRHFRH